jgi:hypothetical protein
MRMTRDQVRPASRRQAEVEASLSSRSRAGRIRGYPTVAGALQDLERGGADRDFVLVMGTPTLLSEALNDDPQLDDATLRRAGGGRASEFLIVSYTEPTSVTIHSIASDAEVRACSTARTFHRMGTSSAGTSMRVARDSARSIAATSSLGPGAR